MSIQYLQLNQAEVIAGLIHNPFTPGSGRNLQFLSVKRGFYSDQYKSKNYSDYKNIKNDVFQVRGVLTQNLKKVEY